MFRTEHVDIVIDGLTDQALKDRIRYKKIYEAIEDYVASFAKKSIKGSDEADKQEKRRATDSCIIVGGSMSIDLLLGKELAKDEFVYVLYSEEAFHHANELSNKLAEVVKTLFADNADSVDNPPWIVNMKTTLQYKRFEILIDQRPLIKFTVIASMSNDSSIFDLISPLNAKSYFIKKTVLILPPRFHLIETYRQLVNPGEFDNWQTRLKDELRLFGYMKKIMDTQAAGKTVRVGAAETSKIDKKAISLKIVKELFVNNESMILLGEHSINMLLKRDVDTNGSRLIPTTENTIVIGMFDPIKMSQNDLKKRVSEIVGSPVQFVNRNVQILGDFRLSRISVKLQSQDIMYIYTSSWYDLIPFNRFNDADGNFIQVGNPFVLIRYMLIEIWVIHWILSIKKIDKAFAESRINSMLSKIIKLRSQMASSQNIKIDEKHTQPGDVLQIFQSSSNQYIGIYESDEKAQKIKAQTVKHFSDYLPQEYIVRHGEYRNLKK